MTHRQFCIRFFALFLSFASVARAGGFQLNEHSARATGMGGAFSALSSDASAIYFNPAGLAFLKGNSVSIGATLIFPVSSFEDPAGVKASMTPQVFTPPNAYFSTSTDQGLSYGIGIFTPFGLGIEWPADWEGRKLATKADIQSFFVNPTIAYKLFDQLSIGAGVSYAYSKVDLSNRVPTFTDASESALSPDDGTVKLEASGSSINFDGGVMYRPFEELSVGVSYRHSTKFDFSGTATFSNMQGLSQYFPGGTGTTTITFPSNLFAGVAYRVSPDLVLEADYQFVGWSSYDTLKVGLPDGPPDPREQGAILQKTQVYPKDWNDGYLLRIGGEYRYSDRWMFRAGYIYDSTPQPDKAVEPLLPDANRNDLTLGASYSISETWSIDAAYMMVLFQDRSVSSQVNVFPGTYKTTAYLFSFDVNCRF